MPLHESEPAEAFRIPPPFDLSSVSPRPLRLLLEIKSSSRYVIRNRRGEDTEHERKWFAKQVCMLLICQRSTSHLSKLTIHGSTDESPVSLGGIPPTLSKCLFFPHVTATQNAHGRSEEGTHVAVARGIRGMQ